jgi:hypothetical protein
MRITLNLDDDIHEYVKKTAQANGQTMGRVLSDLLRKGLNMPEPDRSGTTDTIGASRAQMNQTTTRKAERLRSHDADNSNNR